MALLIRLTSSCRRRRRRDLGRAARPAPPHSLLKKMRFVVFRKSDSTLPAKVALEAPVATHAPSGPLPRPLLRTCAAEEVVFEIHAQHARQLRHTASPLALRLAPCCRPCGRVPARRALQCLQALQLPHPPYGTRCLIGTIHRPACIRAFRAFQRGNLIRVTFVCRCVALPCCLCTRLISFDILAPTISQSAQCR